MHHVGALSVVKISVLPELIHRFDKVPLESQPSFSMLTGNGAVTHGKGKGARIPSDTQAGSHKRLHPDVYSSSI